MEKSTHSIILILLLTIGSVAFVLNPQGLNTSKDWESSSQETISANNKVQPNTHIIDSEGWPMSGRTGYRQGSIDRTMHPPLTKSWEWLGLEGNWTAESVVVAGNKVVLSATNNEDHKVVAVDRFDHVKLWEYILPENDSFVGAMGSVPAIYNDTVFVGGQGNDHIFALDADTGTQLWNVSGMGSTYSSHPIASDGAVYIVGNDVLYKINASNGNIIWTNVQSGFNQGTPAVAFNWVYVGENYGTFFELSKSTGAISFSEPNSGAARSAPVVDNFMAYTYNDTHILAFDRVADQLAWTYPIDGAPILSEGIFATANDVLFASTWDGNDGALLALNALNGSLLWQENTSEGDAFDTPTVANGHVYVNSLDNSTVYAYHHLTGDKVWEVQANIFARPVVAHNNLYLVHSDGVRVYNNFNRSNDFLTWPMAGQNNRRTGEIQEFDLAPPLKIDWTFQEDQIALESISVSPDTIVMSGTYNSTHYLLAVDRSSRSLLWKEALPGNGGGSMSSTPTIYNDVVYVGGQGDNNLYAYDLRTGNLIWRFAGVGTMYSSHAIPRFDDLFVKGSNTFYKLSATTGYKVWETKISGTARGSPAIAGTSVFIGADNGTLFALDPASGFVKWKVTDASRHFTTPVYHQGTVYVDASDSHVKAFDASDGTLKWETNVTDMPLMQEGVLAVKDNMVFVTGQTNNASNGAHLYALDTSDGSILWRFTPNFNNSFGSTPTVTANHVYVNTWKGNLYALDMNGNVLWNTTADYGRPVVADNQLYSVDRHELRVFKHYDQPSDDPEDPEDPGDDTSNNDTSDTTETDDEQATIDFNLPIQYFTPIFIISVVLLRYIRKHKS